MPNIAVKMDFAGDASDTVCRGDARDPIDRFTAVRRWFDANGFGEVARPEQSRQIMPVQCSVDQHGNNDARCRRRSRDRDAARLAAAACSAEACGSQAAISRTRRDAVLVQCRTHRSAVHSGRHRVRPGASFDLRDTSELENGRTKPHVQCSGAREFAAWACNPPVWCDRPPR